MVIDARGLKSQELFIKLKEMFSSERGRDVFIEVLLDTRKTAKEVRAFISMAGCRAELKEKEGYYIINVTGNPCCV